MELLLTINSLVCVCRFCICLIENVIVLYFDKYKFYNTSGGVFSFRANTYIDQISLFLKEQMISEEKFFHKTWKSMWVVYNSTGHIRISVVNVKKNTRRKKKIYLTITFTVITWDFRANNIYSDITPKTLPVHFSLEANGQINLISLTFWEYLCRIIN